MRKNLFSHFWGHGVFLYSRNADFEEIRNTARSAVYDGQLMMADAKLLTVPKAYSE